MHYPWSLDHSASSNIQEPRPAVRKRPHLWRLSVFGSALSSEPLRNHHPAKFEPMTATLFADASLVISIFPVCVRVSPLPELMVRTTEVLHH